MNQAGFKALLSQFLVFLNAVVSIHNYPEGDIFFRVFCLLSEEDPSGPEPKLVVVTGKFISAETVRLHLAGQCCGSFLNIRKRSKTIGVHFSAIPPRYFRYSLSIIQKFIIIISSKKWSLSHYMA